MLDVDILDDSVVELKPFGSFPVWSKKDIMNAELPEYEGEQDRQFGRFA